MKYYIFAALATALFSYVFALGNKYGPNAWELTRIGKANQELQERMAVFEKNDSMTFEQEELSLIKKTDEFSKTAGIREVPLSKDEATAFNKLMAD